MRVGRVKGCHHFIISCCLHLTQSVQHLLAFMGLILEQTLDGILSVALALRDGLQLTGFKRWKQIPLS